MPHDRRTARLLLAMTGLVGVAVTVGCMRPSTLRSSAGNLPELSPAGELHPVAGEASPGPSPTATVAPTTSWARNASQPVSRPAHPAANASQPGSTTGDSRPAEADAANPPAPAPASSAAPGDQPAPPMTSPTPLLDAEIRRVESVTRQQIESLRSADAPTPPVEPVAAPPDRPEPSPSPAADAPKPPELSVEAIAPVPLAMTPRLASEPKAAGSTGGIVVPPLTPIEPQGAGSDRPATVTPTPSPTAETPPPPPNPAVTIAAEDRVSEPPEEAATPPRSESVAPDEARIVARPDAERPSKSGADPAQDDRQARPALEIAAMRLCSGVKDFGEIQPMSPDAIRPGRDVLVYCEMVGLEWEPCDKGVAWRLDAHLELRSGTDGRIVWERALGTAKYAWPRRRHDNFVSYKITWPGNLEPGTYRLRLIQTDLIANRTTSSEIPVSLVR